MTMQELNDLSRRQLEAEAIRRGYRPDPDDTDEDLRSVIHQRDQRKAA